MKPDQIITIVVSVLLSGYVAYITSVRRDRLSKQRDLRTQYLLEAYRRLESATNRPPGSPADFRALESAIADIQLLGSPEQVHLAKKFTLDFAGSGAASFNQLLEDLRRELRKELALPPLDESIAFLRVVPDAEDRKPAQM